MASWLKKKLCCIKHCWGAFEQNNIVNSARVNDWTTELAIIASNGEILSGLEATLSNTIKKEH